MPPAIRVENLSKRYNISHEDESHGKYRTLRDSLTDMATAPLRKLRQRKAASAANEDFWEIGRAHV